MNTIGSRGPSLRGYQWRKVVLDLNAPPCEIIEQEGTSEQVGLKEVACQPVHPASPATIDVEVIDDDVTETSATAFAEAKNNSRRSSGRTVVDVDSGWLTRSTNNNQNKHRRPPPSQTVINCDHYINLESTPQFIERHVWLVIRSKTL
ncbi:hypothetical protein ES319_A07G216700v1 [Gossypium barbadense]|uniref:Uncharacterized protein n=1 Tax=Gossypium barbadense TaxID=3634 RepID=A0A5J5V6M6_GOSBA|nr:hypothetical protein ES319_A07G216700v1 [Gossypium barbadense]KAB2075353.1 hypothetical protein ES319_A07G216700v1 [Gossypium barbadense]